MTTQVSDSYLFFVLAMKHRRRQLSLTQAQVADRAGVSLVTVNQIEGLKRTDPEMVSLENIAHALDYNVEDMIILGRKMASFDVEDFRLAVGAELRKIRESRGLSKNVLSQRVGMSGTHLSNIENGVSSPTLDKMYQICKALNAPLDKIIGDAQRDLGKKNS